MPQRSTARERTAHQRSMAHERSTTHERSTAYERSTTQQRSYDYVAVGHVTIDVVEDAPGGVRRQPGGGAFYSALQAARLGLRALIVTRGVREQIERVLSPFSAELDVDVLPSEHTTTLATCGRGTARKQRVLAWAGAIEQSMELDARILHFAPVAREMTRRTAEAWAGVAADARFVGLTPQGLVRRWAADGQISLAQLDAAVLPERVDAVALNESERASCDALLRAEGPARSAVIAITAGDAPIELHMRADTRVNVAPIEAARVRDDLGAGDVFAAAFFIALARGRRPVEATRLGSAAAAVRMTADGPAAIGNAAAIEALV